MNNSWVIISVLQNNVMHYVQRLAGVKHITKFNLHSIYPTLFRLLAPLVLALLLDRLTLRKLAHAVYRDFFQL